MSMASVIREAVDTIVNQEEYRSRRQRAIEAIGRYTGGGPDVAREHDRYLDEAYAD
jgi:hypothetical protein